MGRQPEEKKVSNNYIIAVAKLIFVFLISCFLLTYTRQFVRELIGLQVNVLYLGLGIFLALFFYIFVADLNGRLQGF